MFIYNLISNSKYFICFTFPPIQLQLYFLHPFSIIGFQKNFFCKKYFFKKIIIFFQARSRARTRYVDEIIEEKSSRWYVDACFINVPEVTLLPFVTSGSNGSNSGSSYTHKEPAFLKIYIFHHCRPFLHTLYR